MPVTNGHADDEALSNDWMLHRRSQRGYNESQHHVKFGSSFKLLVIKRVAKAVGIQFESSWFGLVSSLKSCLIHNKNKFDLLVFVSG